MIGVAADATAPCVWFAVCLLSFLEGVTNCVGSHCFTYGDLTCCAVGVTIVINTVLYITLDTLNVALVSATAVFACAFFVIHSY